MSLAAMFETATDSNRPGAEIRVFGFDPAKRTFKSRCTDSRAPSFAKKDQRRISSARSNRVLSIAMLQPATANNEVTP